MKKAFQPYHPGMGTHGIKKEIVCPDEAALLRQECLGLQVLRVYYFPGTMTGNRRRGGTSAAMSRVEFAPYEHRI